MGRARVTLPPGAFLQATVGGEETLARLVIEHCGEAKTVADLFAGVGPFALRLAERARVTAADSDREPSPRSSALPKPRKASSPSGTQARDLFRRPFARQPNLKRFDAVVFDPPRQGAEAQARELAASRVPLVIAVSCNPATFARDARILADGGYRLDAGHASRSVSLFEHVECCELVLSAVRALIPPAVPPHLLADGAGDPRRFRLCRDDARHGR